MSYSKPLAERERALEAAFFRKEERRLIEALRARTAHEEAVEALAKACGLEAVADRKVVEALLDAGVSPGAVAALAVIPLVVVAWASGRVEPKEREAILEVARGGGFDQQHEPHALLDAWLAAPPPPALFEAWQAYAQSLASHLDGEQGEGLRRYFDALGEEVARAAGGVAGLGSVSREERAVLDAIDRALSAHGPREA